MDYPWCSRRDRVKRRNPRLTLCAMLRGCSFQRHPPVMRSKMLASQMRFRCDPGSPRWFWTVAMRSVAVDARRPLRVDVFSVFQPGAESGLNRLLFEFREVLSPLEAAHGGYFWCGVAAVGGCRCVFACLLGVTGCRIDRSGCSGPGFRQ